MGCRLDVCQARFHREASSRSVYCGIISSIFPLSTSYVHSNGKVSGRPSFQLSLVTSSNNELRRVLIELERSWLHGPELHELITLQRPCALSADINVCHNRADLSELCCASVTSPRFESSSGITAKSLKSSKKKKSCNMFHVVRVLLFMLRYYAVWNVL